MVFKVFLSMTFEDLAPYRQAALEVIHALHMQTVDVTHGQDTHEDFLHISQQALRGADVFVGIYASRYGEIPYHDQLSINEQLYEDAGHGAIPRLIYIAHPEANWPIDTWHTDERAAFMRLFLDRLVEENKSVRYFNNPDELRDKLRFDLARTKAQHNTTPPFVRRHFLIGVGICLIGLVLVGTLLLGIPSWLG